MRFYRFELAYYGEHQDVGFLQGLDEIGLETETEAWLLDQFEPLPCPDLAPFVVGEQVSFWFTELGLRTFISAIRKVQAQILDYGWEVLFSVIDVSPEELAERAVYSDKDQFAFPAAWVKDGMPKYHPLPSLDVIDWTTTLESAIAS